MDPIIGDALEAAAARTWERMKVLLHPYVRWSESDGPKLRGRVNVLRWPASQETTVSAPQAVELRDGQVYRWTG